MAHLYTAHAMSSATATFASSYADYANDKSAPTSIVEETRCFDLKRDEGRLVHEIVEYVLTVKGGWSIKEPKTPTHYDVFINHRGKDVKNTLASHLYYRLSDCGLKVFFDKEEAQKGYRINSLLENAIRVSSVQIAIFSKGYAESEWCLDELLLMLKSKAVIIPVFYNVNPTNIWRNRVDGLNGVYAEALLNLKEEKIFNPGTRQEEPRCPSQTIKIWNETLREVTGRDGLKLETYDGDEGQLVDNVVRAVVREVVKRKVKDFEAKYRKEKCQKNNVRSSERERCLVLRDSAYIRRQSIYGKNQSFYY